MKRTSLASGEWSWIPTASFAMPRGYEGDLEAGLERYERKFGPQTDEATAERNLRKAIPDYARWRELAEEPGADEQWQAKAAVV